MSRSRFPKVISIAVAGAVLAIVPGAAVGDTSTIKAIKCDKTDLNEWGRCWKPSFRHIIKGNTIKWANPAGNDVTHSLTAYKGFKKNVTLAPGESTTKKFRRAGEFGYRCRFHSRLADGSCRGMCGEIHVTKT